jgi:hypothetical protein
MEISLRGLQEQVVPVAFSIGHGVIKPLALIPLQTCSFHAACSAYSTTTENDLIARMASLFLYLLLHYPVEADLSSKIKFPMQPSEKLIYCYHAES